MWPGWEGMKGNMPYHWLTVVSLMDMFGVWFGTSGVLSKTFFLLPWGFGSLNWPMGGCSLVTQHMVYLAAWGNCNKGIDKLTCEQSYVFWTLPTQRSSVCDLMYYIYTSWFSLFPRLLEGDMSHVSFLEDKRMIWLIIIWIWSLSVRLLWKVSGSHSTWAKTSLYLKSCSWNTTPKSPLIRPAMTLATG